MDTERFDVLVRSLSHVAVRRTAVGALIGAGLAVLLGPAADDATARKKRRKKKRKRCLDGRRRCGKTCCPASQACVNGSCGCPDAACAAAVDPTNDQFENCFCELATDGQAHCFANLSCSDPPPTCQETSECAAGEVCVSTSCAAVSRCSPVCSLR